MTGNGAGMTGNGTETIVIPAEARNQWSCSGASTELMTWYVIRGNVR